MTELHLAGLDFQHFVLGPWLAPLGSLRRINIHAADTRSAVAGSLRFLTALESLELDVNDEYGTRISPDACLRASHSSRPPP